MDDFPPQTTRKKPAYIGNHVNIRNVLKIEWLEICQMLEIELNEHNDNVRGGMGDLIHAVLVWGREAVGSSS